MAAADHREGIGAGEDARASNGGDGLLAGVDQIGIDVGFLRERSDAEQAVLGLQGDGHAVRNIVRDQGRDAYPQVHVIAVFQFLCGTLGHHQTLGRVFLCAGAGDGAELDALLVVHALDDAVNVNAGGVNVIGFELAHFDQLFHFGDANLAAGRDHGIEIARGLAIDEVAGLVALPGFDDGDIRRDAFFEHVFDALEDLGLLAFGELGAGGGTGVEAGNTGTAGAQALGEGALRG